MPTYQYVCTDCGDNLEVVQKFSDDPLTTHDACGGRLRKVFSPVGIVFKGSGFYRTDSRNGSNSTTAAKTDKSDKTEKSEKSAPTESTPAKSEGTTAPATSATTSTSGSSSKVALSSLVQAS